MAITEKTETTTGARDRGLETGWLPDTPVEDSVFRRFLHNQAALGEVIAGAHGGRVRRTPDAFLADAASVVPFHNQALPARPLHGLDDPVLDEVETFFAGSGRTSIMLSLWPTPDLTRRGWTLWGHPMFVLRAPGNPEPASRHEALRDVEVRRVVDVDGMAVAERLAVQGYPVPAAVGSAAGSVMPPELLGGPLTTWLGLLEGRPVATASAHVGHGVLNLCLAATLPAARRRGVWQALVRARVRTAPHLPTVAFTSDDSRPGFVRMGFLPVTRTTLWARDDPRAR